MVILVVLLGNLCYSPRAARLTRRPFTDYFLREVILLRTPHYDMPKHPRFKLGRETVHTMKIVEFLRYIVEQGQLSISDYLEAMRQDSFFLVAATGLGKTVAVPVHVLVRLMQEIGDRRNPQPRVWVVEPRIPIATDQTRFMNELWREFLQYKRERPMPPLFGCITSNSPGDDGAPIMFITTGIFEIKATNGELSPLSDRVIIDEAHVTVEQNPGVELGIALARTAGVTVDFMSATVDVVTLQQDLQISTIIRADKQRFTVWKHNLGQPLDDALPELVQATLISPDPQSQYFPQPGEFREAQQVCAAVLERGRSHGLLAVVNSFAGEQSDIQRLADMLRRNFPGLPVLQLASEVVRDPQREREFKYVLQQIESTGQNYVILATSVVEMGITFPTLDFVVTMDSGYDQETVEETLIPVVAPLGVNSLLQRLGRVGRKRPGIGYISYEVGADYAEMEDEELNSGKLRYEPISFPMASAPLMPLAYYACKHDWVDLTQWVASLELPSRLHQNADRMAYLQEQIDLLEVLGIAVNNRLTPFGERMSKWIGRTDLAYAVQLQFRFEAGCELPELLFWIVVTALSMTPLVTLRAQHDYFVDYYNAYQHMLHRIDIWSNHTHEDVAAFGAIVQAAYVSPVLVFGDNAQMDTVDTCEFEYWCYLSGLNARRLQKVGSTIAGIWKLFGSVNKDTERFHLLFYGDRLPSLASLPWRHI